MKEQNSVSRSSTGGTSQIIAKSFLYNLLSNIFLYLGHLIIARSLPREDYATFVVIVSFVSLAALFADLGITSLFVRKFAEAEALVLRGQRDSRGELIGSILVLRIFLAILVSAIVTIITPLLGYPAETRSLISIMLVTLIISSRLIVVRAVGEAFLRGANKYHLVTIFAALDAFVFVTLLYISSQTSLDLRTAIWIYTFCHLPGFLLLFGFIYRQSKLLGFRIRFHFRIIKAMTSESLPLILSAVFFTIHSQADPLILDKLSNFKEVSAFGAAQRILSAIIFLPLIFSAVIAPKVTQAAIMNEYSPIRISLDRSLRLLLVLALGVAILLSSSSSFVINFLFGTGKYADSTPLVVVFGWAFIPICFGAFMIDIAVAEGKLWLHTLYTFILVIISVSCDFLLVPTYGALGAGIAKCLAVTGGSIGLYLTSNSLKVLDKKKIIILFLRIVIVGIISVAMSFACSILNLVPFVSVIATISLSLILVIFVFKIISFEEIGIFLSGFVKKPVNSIR